MAIDIPPQLTSVLEREITLLLEDARYSNGKYLESSSQISFWKIDELIKNRKQLQIDLASLGERPLSTFISQYLSRELAAHRDFDSNSTGLLTELDFLGTAEQLSKTLVMLIKTLPWPYTITYVLPENLNFLLPDDTKQFALSESVRLLRVTEDVQLEFPITTEARYFQQPNILASLFLSSEKALPLGRILFQTQVFGHIGVYGPNHSMRLADTQLKAFLGYLLSMRTIEYNFALVPYPPKFDVMVHERHQGEWEITRRDSSEDDISRLCAKIKLYTASGDITDEKIPGWIGFGLTKIRAGFSKEGPTDKLQLAAKWLVESYSNNQDLLGFVQAMVSLEILLGEKEENNNLSIGSTIRNRCAYLIGSSFAEREEIHKHLSEIYRVRSKIVHTGKDTLTQSDYMHLFMLRSYCLRVIARELEVAASQ